MSQFHADNQPELNTKKWLQVGIGVATIGLVSILVLLGLLCVLYSYFRSRILRQGLIKLNHFNDPWIIRITFILFSIWWGFGEIIRLDLLRRPGTPLYSIDLLWQETVCKSYIISNLAFAEPCFFLSLTFLLRAPLQKIESGGTLNGRKSLVTTSQIFLYCNPVIIVQLLLLPILPQVDAVIDVLPDLFTNTYVVMPVDHRDVAFCTYPLLSTIIYGILAVSLTVYLFWLGSQILNMVINKGLQKRVYTVILSVSVLLPMRAALLGLSVMSLPEYVVFDMFSFLAFLALLCCAGVCICMLVYCPVADSLALGSIQDGVEEEVERRLLRLHIFSNCKPDLIINHQL